MLTISEMPSLPSVVPFAISSSPDLAGLEDELSADENEITAEGQSKDDSLSKAAKLAEFQSALAEIQLKIAQLEGEVQVASTVPADAAGFGASRQPAGASLNMVA